MESSAAWIVCVGLSLSAASALAQQQSHYTPIAAEQRPQTLHPLPTGARPLVNESQAVRSQAPYRLASTEAPAAETPQHTPLRLAPRSDNARGAVGKPPKPAASVSGTLGTVGGSLAIVLGLFFVVVWCSRRFAPSGSAVLPKEAVELLGRTSFAGRQQVQLLRVGNKLLLVGVSAGGMEMLTEISEPAEVEHLLSLCRREQPGSSSAAFRQVLSQLASEPASGGFVGTAGSSPRGGR